MTTDVEFESLAREIEYIRRKADKTHDIVVEARTRTDRLHSDHGRVVQSIEKLTEKVTRQDERLQRIESKICGSPNRQLRTRWGDIDVNWSTIGFIALLGAALIFTVLTVGGTLDMFGIVVESNE